MTGNHTKDSLLSLCIVKHWKKRDNISTDVEDYPHSRRALHLLFKFLRKIPTFSCDVKSRPVISNSSSSKIDDEFASSNEEEKSAPFEEPFSIIHPSEPSQQKNDATQSKLRKNEDKEEFSTRKKAEKDAMVTRQNKMETNNGQAIADSVMRKKGLLA